MKASWPSARRWLLASAGSPIVADQRVILIEGADRANEQAQNALLKALEEPSPRQMFVLVADEPGRLLPTIRSRAQPLRVGPVPKAELRAWLIKRRAPGAGTGGDGQPDGRRADRTRHRLRARRPTCSAGARRPSASCWSSLAGGPRGAVRLRPPSACEAAARLGSPAVEEAEPADDEAPRLAGAAQRAAALLVIGAWRDLARDLLMVAAGRPRLVAAVDAR